MHYEHFFTSNAQNSYVLKPYITLDGIQLTWFWFRVEVRQRWFVAARKFRESDDILTVMESMGR